MILGDNPERHGFVLGDLVLIELFQIGHNCVTECMLQAKFLLKLIQKLLEMPFLLICGISQYVIFLSNRVESLNFQTCKKPSLPPQFPCFVGHPDLPMRKALKVVGLLTGIIFFQSKKFAAWKIKDEKEKIIFYFLVVFNLLKIIHPFESKKHLRTQ